MFTNTLINLVSLQRSGTHAIGYWLIHQCSFIRSYYELEKTSFDIYHRGLWPGDCGASLFFNNRFFYQNYLITPNSMFKQPFTLCFGYIDIAIISYEISRLRDFKRWDHFQDKDELLGKIKQEHGVLVLRDFKNLVASWLHKSSHVPPHIIKHYGERCREILGQTNLLGGHYFINYNKWFIDIEYRKQICEDLNLHFTDFGKKNVPHFGGGSSFDRMEHKDDAEKMNVLTRYKVFENNIKFKDLLRRYDNLLQMSNEIFGEV